MGNAMSNVEALLLKQQAQIARLLLEMDTIRQRTLEQAALDFSLVKSKKMSREAVVNALMMMARS